MTTNQNYSKDIISDKQLFLAISKESEMAFQLVFERYRQPMWSFVMTLVKSPDIAEDIVQESFIKLWEMRGSLADVVEPKDFIFIIVRNRALDALRKLAHQEKGKESVWNHLKQQSDYSDYWLEAEQAAQILKQIIAQLPAQQQKVIHLSRDLGLSHQEIAEQLNISKKTINNHIVAALKTCREQLKKLGFTYFFILPLGIVAPYFVFSTDDENWSNEENEQTIRETVAEIQHELL